MALLTPPLGSSIATPILIGSAIVAESNTYVALVRFADMSAAWKAENNGLESNVLFTDAEGAQLPHEIKGWDAVTWTGYAWVGLSLSALVGGTLYCCTGGIVDTTSDSASVFSTINAYSVHHLDESVAGPYADASGSNFPLTNNGLEDVSDGKSGAAKYNGTPGTNPPTDPRYAYSRTKFFPDDQYVTVDFWYRGKPRVSGADQNEAFILGIGSFQHSISVLCNQKAAGNGELTVLVNAEVVPAYFRKRTEDNESLPADEWTKASVVYDGPAYDASLYVNGTYAAGQTKSTTGVPFYSIYNGNRRMYLGRDYGLSANCDYDEVRWYGEIKSAGWLATDYRLQNHDYVGGPNAAYSLGEDIAVSNQAIFGYYYRRLVTC